MKLLAISGKKSSGKSTLSNFIHGYQLRCFNIIDNFNITEDGKLVVETSIRNNNKEEKGLAFLDVNRRDGDFVDWASYNMWPYVKKYSFADSLKIIAIELFNLTQEMAYGTEEQKNQIVPHLLWENMPGVITKEALEKEWGNMLCDWLPNDSEYGNEEMQKALASINLTYHAAGPMTAREFLQFFGTEICRKIYSNIWTNRAIKNIQEEQSLLAVIDDCRFKNEADAVKAAGGKVIRLTRSISEDSHDSENDLNDYSEFDKIIDNQDMSIHETNLELMKTLEEWGWLGEEIELKKNTTGIQSIKR